MQRLLLLAVLVTACDGGERRDADTVATPAPVVAAAPTDTSKQGCPATGLWARCSVVERLERSGLIPRVDSTASVDEPPLAVRGVLVRVGTSELELYVFPSVAAREAASARLDTAKYLAYGRPVPIQPTPTLIQSANLVAILHSRNDHQRERVGDALTAGPPQPARP